MKNTEFRIGNYVQDFDCEPYIFQIEEIRKHIGFENWVFYRNGSIKAKEVEPIPLTEEWLVSLGFIPTESNFFGKINYWNKEKDCSIDVETVCVGTKIEKIFRYRICSDVRTKCIIYVHSLQNLHFALKGEELILKKD